MDPLDPRMTLLRLNTDASHNRQGIRLSALEAAERGLA